MNNNRKKLLGFTLMEVLLASTIFALILVFTTAAVSQTSNYQSKLSIINKTSEETRRIADLITQDVRGANSEIKVSANNCVNLPGNTDPNTNSFKNGIAFLGFDASGSFCVDHQDQDDVSLVDNLIYDDILVISNKTEYILYTTLATSGQPSIIVRRTYSRASVPDNRITWDMLGELYDQKYQISKSDLSVKIKFGGFAPSDVRKAYGQAIVNFLVSAESTQTDIPNSGVSEIRSAVTSRSYN